jgi:hypothetical protein
MDIIASGLQNVMAVLPALIGALVILLIGWIVGRVLGKAVRFVIDKVTETVTATPVIGDSDITKSVIKSPVSLGYLGDIAVRILIYMIAILAAVDILNLDYMIGVTHNR